MDLAKINQTTLSGFDRVDLEIVKKRDIDVFSKISRNYAIKILKQSLINCYELIKINIKNETVVEKDAGLLYDLIAKDVRLLNWSLTHFDEALIHGFLEKDESEMNVVSPAKCLKYIKAFAEKRAKAIIKADIIKERHIEEKKAVEQIPEKKINYLNQICKYYNNGDYKDCNDIGMRSIYFKTLYNQAETDQAKTFFKNAKKEAENSTESLKTDFLKIYTKEYFVFSKALGIIFNQFEKLNRKLIVEVDKIKSVPK